MVTAVETHQLTKIYEPARGWRTSRAKPVQAVSDITLKIPIGELFGLLGPNGAGKTTLVKMLCTLIRPNRGTAVVAGQPLSAAEAIRGAVGLVVSDERSFYWRLSARRNLAFFAAMYGLKAQTAQDRIDRVLADVELTEMADTRFSHFSSGMRQRLAIARALLHQPRLLFLDEPSRSLDPTGTQNLHRLILRLRQEQQMTIFLITHDLTEAETLCDRVALMHGGRIQAVGSPQMLRDALRPQRYYTMQTAVLDTAVLHTLKRIIPTIYQDETGLHFQASETDGLLTAVLTHLHQNHIPVQSIQSSAPTLEEVFTHFTQETPRANGHHKE